MNCPLLSTSRIYTPNPSLPQCGLFVRYQHTPSDSDGYDESPSRRPKSREFQRQNIHRQRSKPRTHKFELDHPFLGKPAEVLVVPDKKRRRSVKKPAKPRAKKEAQLPFLLDEFESEKGPLDSSVVAERIESLRSPRSVGDKLSQSDWTELRNSLRSSFTTQQLSGYIAGDRKRDIVDTEANTVHRNHSNLGEWRPGTSHFLETGPSQERLSGRVAATRDAKGKDLLVERVLRDCWQLGVSGEIGQLDIRFPKHALSLLISSELFSFADLAKLHGTQIDVTSSLGLVRVTGNQRSCESVREIIRDYTNRIRTVDLNFFPPKDARSKVSAQTFTPEFLSWVAATHKVAFEESSSQIPTRLYVLSENQANAQDARRTLNLALHRALFPSVSFSTYVPASEHSGVGDVNVQDIASWHDRQKSWFRWETLQRSDFLARLPSHNSSEHQSTHPDELLKFLRRAPSVSSNFRSGFEMRESITASVGKCLFLKKPLIEEQVSASQLGQMSLARTFVRDAPVASLISNMTPRALDSSFRIHRIRLVPTALHDGIIPSLDLEFAFPQNIADSTGRPSLRSAEAVLAENHVDYLIPEGMADIRFTRKLTRELPDGVLTNDSLKNILEDMAARFHNSLVHNTEVPLPAFKHITFPSNLLCSSGEGHNSDRVSSLEYMILPVNDIQGTAVNQYAVHDKHVLYSSYDSGPYDSPNVTDLSLELKPKDQSVGDTDKSLPAYSNQISQKDFSSFYNAACTLVSELD